MSTIPEAIRKEVITTIYERLDRMKWESCSSSEKSEAYRNMVNDPKIGGRLAPFMADDRRRVWIKDGPAKEYGRALEGIGAYAEYTHRQVLPADDLVKATLGTEWSIDGDSIQDKPMRAFAEDAQTGERRLVIWAAHTAIKDMIWQVICHRAADPGQRPAVIVVRPSPAPMPVQQRRRYQAVCETAGAELFETQRLVGRKPSS